MAGWLGSRTGCAGFVVVRACDGCQRVRCRVAFFCVGVAVCKASCLNQSTWQGLSTVHAFSPGLTLPAV